MERVKRDESFLLNKIREKTQNYSASNPLSNLDVIIENVNFDFTKSINVVAKGLAIKFNNCSFNRNRIDFVISELKDTLNSIEFNNCEINCDIFIKESKLYNLSFDNVIIKAKSFHISSNEIYRFSMIGDPKKLNDIDNLILNRNHKIEYFDFRMNHFNTIHILYNKFYAGFTMNGNKIGSLQIDKCDFQKVFEFWKNELRDSSLIQNSTIGEVKALESNFGIETKFRDVIFIARVDFTYLKSYRTTLKFEECTFEKNLYFDYSNIQELQFKSVVFKNIVSFQNLKINHLLTYELSHFETIGFFDGIEIGSLKSIDLNTIRLIKGQLSKSENKIDYLKFNALEQRKKFQQLDFSDADYYILWLNKISNDFGRNWFTGVKFTLKCSIFFFIILILVNSFINSEYPLKFNYNYSFAGASQILSEYLKFTFSLGFSDDKFASNGFLYLIFIISKIFIGYGIYQTITAFRKYGRI